MISGAYTYLFALTVVFAVLIHFIKGKGRGRPKDSQVVPDPRVRYGQVIKQRAGRRLVSVTRRVIFGIEELIPLEQISTSLLERLNGTIRLGGSLLVRGLFERDSVIRRKSPSRARVTVQVGSLENCGRKLLPVEEVDSDRVPPASIALSGLWRGHCGRVAWRNAEGKFRAESAGGGRLFDRKIGTQPSRCGRCMAYV